MIDLRFSELPSQILCDGVFYSVNTDFRTWINFGYELTVNHNCWYGIFSETLPDGSDWVESAIEFYRSENVTPRSVKQSPFRSIDFVLDGDYIVAAFQQAYGIDLTDPKCNIHWHRFKALISGLPDNTLMSQIIHYRTWERKGKTDHDSDMRRLREMWMLPDAHEEEKKQELLAWADEFFG